MYVMLKVLDVSKGFKKYLKSYPIACRPSCNIAFEGQNQLESYSPINYLLRENG